MSHLILISPNLNFFSFCFHWEKEIFLSGLKGRAIMNNDQTRMLDISYKFPRLLRFEENAEDIRNGRPRSTALKAGCGALWECAGNGSGPQDCIVQSENSASTPN